MEPSQWDQVEQVFREALGRPPDARPAFLESRCDDPTVREEVASLLEVRGEGPDFFSAAARAVNTCLEDAEGGSEEPSAPLPANMTDRHVGPYRLVEEIGMGGMSVVYRAERVGSGFEQTVAVKLLQRRLHADDAEQRFRAERQVLASLDHPNIARLIDGGVTDAGRAYFVMEHVDGSPVTTYADEHDLGVEARLELLEQVFEAVEAAHRQLVVHRDLKPSNVLVTETAEGRPRVKLLDFGIAKLIGEALPVPQPETRTGQRFMTPAYAAPEQVSGGEITTATDVYQLGVLAYELLAGTRPFSLEEKSLTEVERILLESTPARPSDAALDRDRANVLRGDLDTILLKALRKEGRRRYRSVEALAADCARYRRGAPVQARSTTVGYRAWKFISRNQGIVGTAALALLLIAAYAVTVTVQANRLAEQRDRARIQAQKAEQVSGFLVDLMSRANPYGEVEESGAGLTVRRVMERGRSRIGELEGQPAVQAELRTVIGQVYDKLGLFEKAESLLKKGLHQRRRLREAPDSTVATSLYQLGVHYRATGDYETADSLLHEALDMRRAVHGRAHPSVAEVLGQIGRMSWRAFADYPTADSLLHTSLRMRRALYGPSHVSVASSLNALGKFYHKQGNYDRAKGYYRRALETYRTALGDHSTVAEVQSNLASLLRSMGAYQEAEKMQRTALSLHRSLTGGRSLDVAMGRVRLGRILLKQDRLAAADSMFGAGMVRLTSIYAPSHPVRVRTYYYTGMLRLRQGRIEEARRLFRVSTQQAKESLPSRHPFRAYPMLGLGRAYMKMGKPATAEPILREATAIREKTFGAKNGLVAVAQGQLGQCLQQQGRYESAESLLKTAEATLQQRPVGDSSLRRVRRALVTLYESWGRTDQAAAYRARLSKMVS